MKKSEIKSIIKEVGGFGSQWDSEAQAKLAAAKANFGNAIQESDADEMLRTYKAIEKPLHEYVKEISGGRY